MTTLAFFNASSYSSLVFRNTTILVPGDVSVSDQLLISVTICSLIFFICPH